MKTKILFRLFSTILITIICISQDLLGQSTRMDSLIYGKDLELIDGAIPMYCAAQCENRGKEAQLLLQNLVETYSSDDRNVFKLKLAVIDSSQWTGFADPYGFFFIRQGWIVIPGDLDFQKLSHLWGYYQFTDVMKQNLAEISNNPENLLTDVLYNFVISHEVGHYYNNNILHAYTPDYWTSEWMASYIATDFLYKFDENAVKAFSIFTSTFTDEFEPEYRKLSDFNLKYASVGLKNYVWYHCMFQPMIEDIYSQYGFDFTEIFAKAFPNTDEPKEYAQEDLLNKLDNITDGITSKWIGIMEGTSE